MIDKNALKEIASQGENASVEFKTGRIRPESLAKEMAAFANGNGGVILFGIDDSGKATGIESAPVDEEWVMNVARNNVTPALEVDFGLVELDGEMIAVVEVPKGKDKPYETVGKYYLRIGSTNRQATQAELLRLFQASGVFHFDRCGVPTASAKDLNMTALDRYFRRYEIEFSEEPEDEKESLLVNTDILTEERQATVAGLLIFGMDPSRHLPQCGISFAHFAGEEIDGELIDRQNLDRTLDYQVTTGLAVIKNNILAPSTISGTRREDTFASIPDKVFRELLVNACVHRNYSIAGSKIRVFMFDDRIEFISPGRLPNTVTVERLKAGVSYAVNPVIVKFMENLRFVDRLGRGLPMVYREMKKIGGRVDFREIGEEFKVTLFWPKS